MRLPEEFKRRMQALLGDEYEEFLKSYDEERALGLRVNRLKMPRERDESLPFALCPVPWAPGGYYYGSEERPGKHPLHEAGVYYIQEPSAMAPAALLGVKPGDLVLDLCAAPGGKTTHAASLMGGEGFLMSNEIHPARAKVLAQNVERMGVGNCVVTNEDSGRLSARFPEFFDKIIVDAPCSGEGMFRKDEEAVRQWSLDHVAMCAARQDGILDHAAAMLKPGGRMVYSTCTFAPEEDEGSVQRFLERHPEFSVERAGGKETACFSQGRPQWVKGGREELAMTFRLWPHRLQGEGHYLALLKKDGAAGFPGNEENAGINGGRKRISPAYVKDRRLLADFYEFCGTALTESSAAFFKGRRELLLFGDQLWLLPPEMPDMAGLKVVRPGLHLGTLKKNRFEPSHALALFLRPDQAGICWEAGTEEAARRYLSGEIFAAGDPALSPVRPDGAEAVGGGNDGWALMTYMGYPLGWVKGSGGVLKNHYPRGLRQK